MSTTLPTKSGSPNSQTKSLICTCVNVEDLYKPKDGKPIADFIHKISSAGPDRLERTYEKIVGHDETPNKGATFFKYPAKNRYSDVVCVERQRVKIRTNFGLGEEAAGEKGYIHANFVHGYKHENAYILTQGPMANTAKDFWYMVWQEGSFVIVQLTKLIEGGREKCYKYWPTQQHKRIKNVDVLHPCQDWDIALLTLTHTKTCQTRLIYHCFYLGWPDFGTPKSSSRFSTFMDAVYKCQFNAMITKKDWHGCPMGPPLVVHCSAGVGRSGTFCAFDIIRRKIEDTGKVDVTQCLVELRKQRYFSVQRLEQFIFIHLAVLELAWHKKYCNVEKLTLAKFVDDTDLYDKIQHKVVNADGSAILDDEGEQYPKSIISQRRMACCFHCGVFVARRHIEEHLASRHETTYYLLKNIENFQCFHCHLRFVRRSHLENHVRTRHRTYNRLRCQYCPMTYLSKKGFEDHCLRHNQPMERKVCVRCFRSYRKDSTLADHLEKMHRVIFCSKCPQCMDVLPGPIALRFHLKTIHKKVQTFQCFCCLTLHTKKWNLALHISEKKSAKKMCFQCGKWFSNSKMNLHFKTTHSTDMHDCFNCLRSYKKKQYLLRHITLGNCVIPKKPRSRFRGTQSLHDCSTCGQRNLKIQSLHSHTEVFHKDVVHPVCDTK